MITPSPAEGEFGALVEDMIGARLAAYMTDREDVYEHFHNQRTRVLNAYAARAKDGQWMPERCTEAMYQAAEKIAWNRNTIARVYDALYHAARAGEVGK